MAPSMTFDSQLAPKVNMSDSDKKAKKKAKKAAQKTQGESKKRVFFISIQYFHH